MLPCHGCAYQRSIPGNCHIRCVFDWTKATPEQLLDVPKNQSGRRAAQWFAFPFNYDPVWGQDTCPARSESQDDAMVAPPNPLADLLSLMA